MLKKWSFLLLICCVSSIGAVLYTSKEPRKAIAIWPVEEEYNQGPVNVNGVIYKASKRYYCCLFNDAEDRQTLLYGSQGWVFPRQDVNLTLAYPSADGVDVGKLGNGWTLINFAMKVAEWNASIPEDHVITGYQVLLFTDGLEGSAYVNSGGLMEDNVSLMFISNNITTLYYRFWLYGAPRSNVFGRTPNNLC